MSSEPFASTIRPIDPADQHAIACVAAGMRATLEEVLGAERAAAVHTDAEIRARLLWHIDRPDGLHAQVLVARDAEQRYEGHVIVRVEPDTQGELGLFSTIWVEPASRRRGLGSQLLRAGQRWLQGQSVRTLATYTEASNTPLQRLFEEHGFALHRVDDEWARLERRI